MGGPRITEEQKQRARKLREQGLNCPEIGRELSISAAAARLITRDVKVDVIQDGETFVDIDGYDGKYQVSNYGRVLSYAQDKHNPKIMNIAYGKKGAGRVTLVADGIADSFDVAELVAYAFLDDCDHKGKRFVGHIDGDWSNNHVDNLVWTSKKPTKQKKRDRANPNAKPREPLLNDEAVEYARNKWLSGEYVADIARELGVSYATVYKKLDGLKRNFELPECETGEEWVDLPGYEGRYFISSHGRLFTTGSGRREAKLIQQCVSPRGYYKAGITDANGNEKTVFVHRLVAEAFCDGRTDDKNVVNHKDGDSKNNHADNLEWCTQAENTRHAAQVLGTIKAGDEQTHKRTVRTVPRDVNSRPSPFRKFTDDQVRSIRRDKRSSSKIAKEYGVNKCTITNIRKGVTYKNV